MRATGARTGRRLGGDGDEEDAVRVLHAFSTFGLGGPQRRAAELAALWGPRAEHVVVAMDGVVDARGVWPKDVELDLMPAPTGGLRARLGGMREILDARRPDLVMTYNWGAIEWLVAARLGKVLRKVVHHEDGFGVVEKDRPLWRRSVARRLLLRGVPAVVVPSRGLERIARELWKVPKDRLHLLPNGVDLEHFRPGPAGTPGARGEVVFGTVGGLRAVKDHALAIRAFARAQCSHGRARLRLVGDGPERAGLEGLAADLGVSDRVDFVGAVRDPAPEYAAMDVFFLSSRTEQMPISLLEAMACALPVVSTHVGDVREVLSPENAAVPGLVPEPEDEKGMAQAFDRLAADEGLRMELGVANRARVERRFEAGSCLGRFVDLYERVAADARNRRRRG